MSQSLSRAKQRGSGLILCSGLTFLLASCGTGEGEAQSALAPGPAATPPTALTLYVAQGGADNNPGTLEAPFQTIARAARAAVPGTTINVAPGNYSGGFKTTVNGTPDARIYYRSTRTWGAKIVPPANSTSLTAWDNRGNYVDIVGFDVDGSVSKAGTKWANGIYSGGSYNVIRNNRVHHIGTAGACTKAGGSGIGVDSYFRGVHSHVIGNTVHDIGPTGCRSMQGIFMNTTGSVKNNVVYRVADAGIHLWHDATDVIISNNTVSASDSGILVGGGDFYFTAGPNDRTQVFNNIVYDNKHGILEQGLTGKNNSYRYNLVFQNTVKDWSLANGLTHSETVASPPQFLAYSKTGTPDFRLSKTSPAIGKGSANHAHPIDFKGRPRTARTGYDIGAYQH